ncbi:MAG: serine O-acetyltransferase [Terrimicrobiaceae bacterium]|nr:serine O-acetyltransferase [Terrimicrobiaceae bacterium]
MRGVEEEHIGALLASYEAVAGLSNTHGVNLPSKQEVGSICEDLLQVTFPGFHDVEPISEGSLPILTRHRVARLRERLGEQVGRSLRVEDPGCPAGRARDVAGDFLAALPGLREILSTDVQAADEGDPAARSLAEIVLAYPCIEAIAIQRLAHWLYKACVPLLPRIMTEWAHARTGIDIHPGAEIGRYFFIDHGTGVVIGETCRIGERVKLYHGVTLGARSFAKDEAGRVVKGGKRHPDVGDGVTIYPNSTILGGETVIGAGSTIGANVFLMQSVPPNTLVTYEEKQLRFVGKPPRATV